MIVLALVLVLVLVLVLALIYQIIVYYTSGGLNVCAVCSHGCRPNEKSSKHGPG